MAIKNWEFQQLHMDFSSMFPDGNHPSDIDMFFLTDTDFLCVAEIKNERGRFNPSQRRRLERLIDGWKADGVCLYVTHNKYVQNGDTEVNVPDCYIQEIYYKNKHQWVKPKKPTKVMRVIEDLKAQEREAKNNADK